MPTVTHTTEYGVNNSNNIPCAAFVAMDETNPSVLSMIDCQVPLQSSLSHSLHAVPTPLMSLVRYVERG